MYRELISDLRYAVEHLPESYGDSEYGRATKYAAAHLLAKMYLNRAQGEQRPRAGTRGSSKAASDC